MRLRGFDAFWMAGAAASEVAVVVGIFLTAGFLGTLDGRPRTFFVVGDVTRCDFEARPESEGESSSSTSLRFRPRGAGCAALAFSFADLRESFGGGAAL